MALSNSHWTDIEIAGTRMLLSTSVCDRADRPQAAATASDGLSSKVEIEPRGRITATLPLELRQQIVKEIPFSAAHRAPLAS
jgi:hypothetical protein